MGEIPNIVLKNLIELGKSSNEAKAERNHLFEQLKPHVECCYAHWNTWSYATEKLSADDLFNLVRGLVVAETALPGWNGGSVSPIIWAFKAYERTATISSDELATWVMQNSDNEYVPYGVNRIGCRSVDEFKAYRKAKESRRQQSEIHAEAERRCKTIREIVTQRLHQESTIIQNARAQARQQLVSHLDGLPKKERLEHIAWDDEHDLTFYPNSYADVTKEEFSSLDEISKERLIAKIQIRHKGFWAELFKKISK
jgi:hypothetical protein